MPRITPPFVAALSLLLTLAVAGSACAAEPAAPTPSPAKKSAPAPAITKQTAPKPAAAAVVRIGYVEMTRFGTDSVPGKEMRARLKAHSDKLRARIVARQKRLEKEKAAIEKEIGTLSPAQREAKAKAFQKHVEEFQKYVQDSEKEMQKMEEGLARQLYGIVEKAANAYGAETGLSAIVVKKELLYLASGVDVVNVTGKVLERVNRKRLAP